MNTNDLSSSSAIYTVCNIDGVPVGEYDNVEHAKSACHDLAREAAYGGDVTNGYHVRELDDFPGYLAKDFEVATVIQSEDEDGFESDPAYSTGWSS